MIFNDSCTDLTPTRGAPGEPIGRPSPWPPAPVLLLLLYFTYYFYSNFLETNSLLSVDPHAGALVPRGRRIQRPAASAADPEEKSRTTWFAGVEVVVLKEEFPVCELHEQETTKVFD